VASDEALGGDIGAAGGGEEAGVGEAAGGRGESLETSDALGGDVGAADGWLDPGVWSGAGAAVQAPAASTSPSTRRAWIDPFGRLPEGVWKVDGRMGAFPFSRRWEHDHGPGDRTSSSFGWSP